ncbi:MAG: aminotransferase class I/II-fold pyridoxal phosphate-dependent enzyme, partial [Anaerolineae bacterium]|nr:aminotransferase class I/II-fold pyridoxal phosphate-dependent enzyme [Anaerolineae bacterium]
SCVNTVAQHAAIGALLGPQDCVETMRQEYRRRRDLAVALADELALEVSYPHGAFYLLADISASGQESIPFCQGLLESEHLAVAPGSSFGSILDSYVRISLCASSDALEEGLTRLARYLRRQAQELAAQETSPAIRATV